MTKERPAGRDARGKRGALENDPSGRKELLEHIAQGLPVRLSRPAAEILREERDRRAADLPAVRASPSLVRGPRLDPEVDRLARIVWDYHHMNHELAPSDVILVQGSHDLRVAERGVELYLEGLAPLIVMSGGLGNLTRGMWDEPEAVKFARVARDRGVPDEAILIESRSTNTGENVRLTRQLLADRALAPKSFILVQKPYMERRTYATFKKVWPEPEAVVTSPRLSFDDYPTEEIPIERVIHIMVGDLQRIRLYPERGFQIEQPIPDDVWAAFERLVALGYTKNLV